MIQKILIDTVLKGTLAGIGSVFVGAVETVIKYTFTRKMAIRVTIDLLDFVTGLTETKKDDEYLAIVKANLIKSGELE
jgi:uncharacterized membrane-anchored protein